MGKSKGARRPSDEVERFLTPETRRLADEASARLAVALAKGLEEGAWLFFVLGFRAGFDAATVKSRQSEEEQV